MSSVLRDDLFGGTAAAVIALPLAIAFGVLTVAPLGPEWASHGALAGLCGAIVAGFLAAMLGGTPPQITGPTGPMTVVMTSLVATLATHPALPTDPSARAEIVLTLGFLCVALGGVGQVILGAMRLGSLVKFIPYPVIAGFMNGIAVIIFVGQVEPLLGLPSRAVTSLDLTELSQGIQPATAAVGAITILVMWLCPRLSRRLPASLFALMAGVASYYVILHAWPDARLGPVIGAIPAGLPQPQYLPRFVNLLTPSSPIGAGVLLALLPYAAALAVLGSIDSLLTSVVADAVTHRRHHSNRELWGQGIGNLAAGIFGGLASAGATVRTLVNIDAGGRTRHSGMIHSLLLLLVLVAGGSLAGRIPLVVLAGVLMATAVKMVDDWSRTLVWKLRGTAEQKREIAINLAVVLLVTTVTVAVDLMAAVGVGMIVACVLFVEKMSRNVVGRVHHGTDLRSRRMRSPRQIRLLDEAAVAVSVFELEGPIFFGTADRLALAVEREMVHGRFLLLDMRMVNEIDSSGARILTQLGARVRAAGKDLLISYLVPGRSRYGFLQDMGVLDVIGAEHVFPDSDKALEWIEERLLGEAGGAERELEVHRLPLLEGLPADELAVIASMLHRLEFKKGELIIRRSEAGDTMFVLSSGTASSIALDSKTGARLARRGPAPRRPFATDRRNRSRRSTRGSPVHDRQRCRPP